MKRNLFAIFLAVTLVMTLVFVIAPSAKAEDSNLIYLDESGAITIDAGNKDKILDLKGCKDATVTFAVDAELKVIDTANTTKDGVTNAGTLKIIGNGSVATVSQDPAEKMRYVAIKEGDTYSFHPFNLTFSKIGINTIAGENNDTVAICLRPTFFANDKAAKAITDFGICPVVEGEPGEVITATKKYSFEGKNLVHAYYDMSGSLDAEEIDKTKSFCAYVVINGKTVYSSYIAEITPREVLKTINKSGATPTDPQKARLETLFANNARVKNILTSFQSSTVTKTNALSFADKAQRTVFTTSQQVWDQNGITLTNDKSSSTNNMGDYANPVRLYANSKVTVTASKMTKIVFTCASSSYATELKNSIGDISGATVAVSSSTVTVTFTQPTNSLVIAKLTKQVQLKTITVTSNETVFASCAHMVTTEATCTVESVCKDCDAGLGFADHIGGTATCTEQAKCDTCGNSYGDLKDHTGGTATCTEQAKCDTCGNSYGDLLAHTGGTATCSAKAVCSVCGNDYGSLAPNNHSALSEATCQAPAHCSGCNKDIGDVVAHSDGDDADTKCDWCETEMSEAEPVWKDASYSYTFTAKQFSANGTKALGGINWTLAGDGSYYGYDATKGQQLGSGSKPYKSMTLTSAVFTKVTKITINTSGAKDIAGNVTVSVGGTAVGTITLTNAATPYTFDVSELTGEIVLSYTQTSSKAIYIKSISVDYKVEAE